MGHAPHFQWGSLVSTSSFVLQVWKFSLQTHGNINGFSTVLLVIDLVLFYIYILQCLEIGCTPSCASGSTSVDKCDLLPAALAVLWFHFHQSSSTSRSFVLSPTQCHIVCAFKLIIIFVARSMFLILVFF